MLDRVFLIILGLVWATTVTVGVETPCNDEDALYAIFTDTAQILTATELEGAKRKQVLALKEELDFDNLAGLPDENLFYLRKTPGGQCYIVPKKYDDHIVEYSKKNGKVTLNIMGTKIRDHQYFDVKVNEEFSADPLAQCLSFEALNPAFAGHKLSTPKLESSRSSIDVVAPSGDPEDPMQSYNIIRVN